jgi:hypothetical protein
MLSSWLTIVFCSFIFAFSLYKIVSNQYSVLHLANVPFYLVQVMPLVVESVCNQDDFMSMIGNMYKASTDYDVHLVYCLFCGFTMLFFYLLGNVILNKKRHQLFIQTQSFEPNILFNTLLILGICLPLIVVFFAPDPFVYFTFGNYYTLKLNEVDESYLFHISMMKTSVFISFLSVCVLYFFNKGKSSLCTYVTYFGVVVFTWFDGKRTLLVFALITIIAIDVVQKKFTLNKWALVKKGIMFLGISVVFFIIYKDYTNKDASMEFLSQYNQYYSRMGCVKTAIYSVMMDKPIVEYPGQSLLFNVFFFVPKFLWSGKPALFCKYFTAYAFNREITDFLPWNLLVNIWTEFISNLGIWGYLFALSIVSFLAKIIDFSKDQLVRFSGTVFLVFYFVFGFEFYVMASAMIFVACIIISVLKRSKTKVAGLR